MTTPSDEQWPALPVDSWQDTRDTLHLWTQIVGKTQLALTAPLNHWWGVTLHVDARGLTTPLMPYPGGAIDISFDFIDHVLTLRTTAGRQRHLDLQPRSVADFYAEYRAHLDSLGVVVAMNTTPVEIVDVTPFELDTTHDSYDPVAVRTFWNSLVSVSTVFSQFRGDYRGKASPVHFFWGAFDLAVTRFSGRAAPEHPGGIPHCPDWVMREAYSAEVSSCGYWPGGADEGILYSYAYPQPHGFAEADLGTPGAAFDSGLGEFILPYSELRRANDPGAVLLSFLRKTFDVAADLGAWPVDAIVRPPSQARR